MDRGLHSAPISVLIDEVSVKVGVFSLRSRADPSNRSLVSGKVLGLSPSSEFVSGFSTDDVELDSVAIILINEFEGTCKIGGCRSVTDPVSVVLGLAKLLIIDVLGEGLRD